MYFISTDRESRQGPFKLEEINQKLMTGQISSDTWVWSKGMAAWQQIKDLEVFGDALDSVPPPFEANEQATPPPFGASESKEQVHPKEPKQPSWIENELKALKKPMSERAKKKAPIFLMTCAFAWPYMSRHIERMAVVSSIVESTPVTQDPWVVLGSYAGAVAYLFGWMYCLPYAPAYFLCRSERTRHRVHWILAVFWCLFNLLSQKYVFVETWPQ